MHGTLTNLAGWIPAIVLPVATLLQLIKLIRTRSTTGVSLMTWLLFGIANIGVYLFTEKYWALQSLIGFLGTAILNSTIVALIVALRAKQPTTPTPGELS